MEQGTGAAKPLHQGVTTTLVIEPEALTRHFDTLCAVDGLDLRVEAGSFYGFLGPNGAGKSTTLKMLTGLLAPTSGRMHLLGHDLTDVRRAREVTRRVGVVPEELTLFDNLTAREYLTFVGRMYWRSWSDSARILPSSQAVNWCIRPPWTRPARPDPWNSVSWRRSGTTGRSTRR